MQSLSYGNATDQYLIQRINGASPEQLVALLLEGAERFLAQTIQAMETRDMTLKARMVNRVSAIIEELLVRLNHEEGGEVVTNLTRIYDWWLHELFAATNANESRRLVRISNQMGGLKEAWNSLHVSKASHRVGMHQAFASGDMVG